MNRRKFLVGIGVGVATLAITTRLATSRIDIINLMMGDFDTKDLRFKAIHRFSYPWTEDSVKQLSPSGWAEDTIKKLYRGE